MGFNYLVQETKVISNFGEIPYDLTRNPFCALYIDNKSNK